MAEPALFRPQYYTVEAEQTYGFHPAAEAYPRADDETFASICDDMRENGYDSRYPIALLKGQIIDGITRYKAARKAKMAFVVCNVPEDTDPEKYVRRANEHRRHLTAEWMRLKREERIKRIVEARVNGESLRTIAERENVSQSTVVTDLKTATEQGCSVETSDGKVEGKDGKKRTSRPNRAPPILCARCQRVAPGKGTKNCDQCKEARAADRAEKKRAKLAATTEANGQEQPEEEDEPSLDEKIKASNRALESWCRGLMDYAATMPHDPWLDKDMNKREAAMTKIRNAAETVRSAKCHGPCKRCNGDGCRTCHQSGRMPKYMMEQV